MNPLLIWELKQRQRYFFWWSLATVAVLALLFAIYPSIRDQADQLNKVINNLPTSLRDLKTGGSQVNIATPIGYLNSQIYYLTLPLIQIIMCVGLGSSILAKDENSHSLELILARPITRTKLLIYKSLAAVFLVLGINTISIISTVLLAKLVNLQIPSVRLVIAGILSMLFSLSFGAIAFAITCTSNLTKRSAATIAIVISFGGYLLASLSSLSSFLNGPAKFAPYHYYNPTQILSGHINNGLIIYLLGIFAVTMIVSWLSFNKRDLA
ncbi:MAG: hypothetical protein NVS1B10_02130 [Candidatus Saccharimonadales bacterium]